MRTLAHYVEDYLFLTGTWLYAQLKHAQQFRPIVLAETVHNLDTFPIPGESLFCMKCDRRFQHRLRTYLRNKQGLSAFDGYFENALKKHKVRSLYSHFGNKAYRNLKLARKLGLRHVTRFYGYDVHLVIRTNPAGLKQYKQMFREIDLVFAEGPFMRQSLIDLGCPSEKVVSVPLGVAVQNIEYKPRVPSHDGKIKVLCAASFTEKKGFQYAVKAFARAKKRIPELTLTMIGGPTGYKKDEEEHKAILKAISESGCSRDIKLLGKVPHQELFSVASDHQIFLSPSVTTDNGDCEGGAPVGMIEMAASGMPVVSTHHCDIPAVVKAGQTGYLVPERDVDALSEALVQMCFDSSKWPEMGKAARAHIESNFNIETQIAKQEELIVSLEDAKGV